MQSFQSILLYVGLFLGMYFQVFLLLTFLGWGKKVQKNTENHVVWTDENVPTVSVIVPCFNEGTTVIKTVESILDLDYVKEKLFVIIVDDGSTDNTWETIQMFANHPQVKLLTKKNEGGKYAALNYGLPYATTDIIGCLDADSRVDSLALRASIREFADPEIMAVVPSTIIEAPKTFFQWMQKVEYEIGNYVRKVFSNLGALYIAPGPFTLFRKEVFEKLGPYKEAYHVEDLAIALDMQVNRMKLIHAHDSFVYTHGPRNWSTLLKQRVRWTYGFIKNTTTAPYRSMLFKRELGHLGMFVLPFIQFSLVLMLVTSPIVIFFMAKGLYQVLVQLSVGGTLHLIPKSFVDPFYMNTSAYVMLGYCSLFFMLATIFIARKNLLGHKRIMSFDIITFLVYPYFAMVWTAKSMFNAVISKRESWR